MIGINAGWRIAPMANLEAIRDISAKYFIGGTMR